MHKYVKKYARVPWWLNELRIQHCHCCDLGGCCAQFDPWPCNFHMLLEGLYIYIYANDKNRNNNCKKSQMCTSICKDAILTLWCMLLDTAFQLFLSIIQMLSISYKLCEEYLALINILQNYTFRVITGSYRHKSICCLLSPFTFQKSYLPDSRLHSYLSVYHLTFSVISFPILIHFP